MANRTTVQSNLLVTIPSLEERPMLAEKRKVDTLLICLDPWALGHSWTNKETNGEQTGKYIRVLISMQREAMGKMDNLFKE